MASLVCNSGDAAGKALFLLAAHSATFDGAKKVTTSWGSVTALDSTVKDVPAIQAALTEGLVALNTSNETESEEAKKWAALSSNLTDESLASIASHLQKRSYLAMPRNPVAADFVLLGSLLSSDKKATELPAELKRWFTRMQGLEGVPEAMRTEGWFVEELAPKEKPKAKAPVVPAEPQRPLDDVTRLEVVVGKVLKVSPHPDADALWCEEIDMGNGEIRNIASGLRAFVTKEEFEGSFVLVLANMKVKTLRGFPSHGMLLCASNDDHTKVELLRPGADAQPGERIKFEGLSGEPDAVLSNKKNNDPLVVILPEFKTNEDKQAHFRGARLMSSTGPCSCASLALAHVS